MIKDPIRKSDFVIFKVTFLSLEQEFHEAGKLGSLENYVQADTKTSFKIIAFRLLRGFQTHDSLTVPSVSEFQPHCF